MAAKRKYQLYNWRGSHIRVFEGDTAPEGATKVEPAPEAKAKQAAPENKARKASPETKSKD